MQVFTGILFLVNGATQTVLDYSSRMCVTPSYNGILDTLKSLSEDEGRKVKAIGRDWEWGLDLTFDNVQSYAKQWEMRIGRENVMRVGMAGTAVELEDFNQQAVNLSERRRLINEGRPKRMSLTAKDLKGLLNERHNRTVGALHWLQASAKGQKTYLNLFTFRNLFSLIPTFLLAQVPRFFSNL